MQGDESFRLGNTFKIIESSNNPALALPHGPENLISGLREDALLGILKQELAL